MLPIKSNSTQEGCNPTSSNCVIWQGPDIPCINLCSGDSISDVTAKLAEHLCDILSQLDITTFDLTCFNPICPNPENFHELVQFIIDKLCELANIPVPDPSPATGCPDCVINLSSCFYYRDELGNTITTMQLSDYAIAIGNRLCSLITEYNATQDQVDDLESRVTNIEENCCSDKALRSATTIVVPTSCLSAATNIPIVTFVSDLESTFCALQSATGTPSEIVSAIGAQCPGLAAEGQLSDPMAPMNTLPGWVNSPINLSDTITNLWLTLCDIRTALASLQSTVETCCTPDCSDIAWDFTAAFSTPNIVLSLTGSVPVSFSYCNMSDATVTIYDAYNNTYTVTAQDVVGNLGGNLLIDISTAPALIPSIYYSVNVAMCLTNGTVTCGSNDNYSFINNSFCPALDLVSPDPGELTVTFPNNVNSSLITYTLRIYNSSNSLQDTYIFSGSSLGLSLSNNFTGLAPDTYYAVLSINQGAYNLTCSNSNSVLVS